MKRVLKPRFMSLSWSVLRTSILAGPDREMEERRITQQLCHDSWAPYQKWTWRRPWIPYSPPPDHHPLRMDGSSIEIHTRCPERFVSGLWIHARARAVSGKWLYCSCAARAGHWTKNWDMRYLPNANNQAQQLINRSGRAQMQHSKFPDLPALVHTT